VLTYIDLFTSQNDWIAEDIPYTEETSQLWTPLPSKAVKLGPVASVSELLPQVYKNIEECLAKKKGNPCIIFDNVSVLLEDEESVKAVCSLVNSLWELSQSHELKPTVYVTVTRNILNEGGEKLVKIWRKSADCLIDVMPNPSGFSKDISGQIRFSGNGGYKKDTAQVKFKLYENKVDVFESAHSFI